MTAEGIADRFVQVVNAAPKEPRGPKECPPRLRHGEPLPYGDSDWKIIPSDEKARWDAVQAGLRFRLPTSLRTLVDRYAWPALQIGPVWLHGNAGEDTDYEMGDCIHSDPHLCGPLLQHGFVRIGQQECAWYDPVCLDYRPTPSGAEPPLVRLDHEATLCFDTIEVIETVAPSFDAAMQAVIDGRWPIDR